jgi:hypothetical protein
MQLIHPTRTTRTAGARAAAATAVTTAAVALATLAGAALPAYASAHDTGTSLSVKSSSRHIAVGDTFTLTGDLRHGKAGLDGQTVDLLDRTGHETWAQAKQSPAQVGTTSDGVVTFTVTATSKGEHFRLFHPAQAVGGATYGASWSRSVTVTAPRNGQSH